MAFGRKRRSCFLTVGVVLPFLFAALVSCSSGPPISYRGEAITVPGDTRAKGEQISDVLAILTQLERAQSPELSTVEVLDTSIVEDGESKGVVWTERWVIQQLRGKSRYLVRFLPREEGFYVQVERE